MNTLMYEHPLTAEHLRIVREVVGYEVVGPIGKNLACGDVGEWLSFLYGVVCMVLCTAELRDGLLDVYHALSTRKAADRQPVGMGAMTEWMDIVKIVVDRFGLVLEERATS